MYLTYEKTVFFKPYKVICETSESQVDIYSAE